MARILLFSMIGGALVMLLWLLMHAWFVHRRKEGRRRALIELADERERVAMLEPGGHPVNPIEVVSPSVVEPRAGSMECTRCEGEVRVVDHQARTVGGKRLRIAQVECGRCGLQRDLYFRLGRH